MIRSNPYRSILLSTTLALLGCGVVTLSERKQEASVSPQATEKQTEAQAMRQRHEEIGRAAFSKAKWMLLRKGVPFDPDMLRRPRWRERLRPAFEKMAEMKQVRRENSRLSGVYFADTLSLPEEVKADGDVLIVARQVIFDGPNAKIRGNGAVYLYFIEAPACVAKAGMGRKGGVPGAISLITGTASSRPQWPIVWSKAIRKFVYAGCSLTVNNMGAPGNPGATGGTHPKQRPREGEGTRGDDGSCVGDPNGQGGGNGLQGFRGEDGGMGGPGERGRDGRPIVCDIPDGSNGSYTFRAFGGDGGKGGTGGEGGPGGDGQKGGRGGNGANCCSSRGVVGNGGDGGLGGSGGRGGDGGRGGNGGDGGNGADITVTHPANFTGSIDDRNDRGYAGAAGDPGPAGTGGGGGFPGIPGDAAPSSFPSCGTSSRGLERGSLGTGPFGAGGSAGESTGNAGDHAGQTTITARPPARTDNDEDGYAPEDGDCNDSDAYVNPGVDPCFNDVATGTDDKNCNGISDFYECNPSPVIIDLGSPGIDLTDAASGVYFDFFGDGVKEKLSWTIPATEDAFLVLDRNGNGLVDNAGEFFGNRTRQPNAEFASNGFEALAWYDLPAYGGNGNDLIDARDAIFATLRLWRDANHDGVSQPEEWSTLASAGIESIETEYSYSRKKDRHGNEFRYRAQVFRTGEAINRRRGHWRFAYDVFFVLDP